MATTKDSVVGLDYWKEHLPKVENTLTEILDEFFGGLGRYEYNGNPFNPRMELEEPNIVLYPAVPNSQIAVCLGDEGDCFTVYFNRDNGRWHKVRLVFEYDLRSIIASELDKNLSYWERHSVQLQILLYDILRNKLGSSGTIEQEGILLFEDVDLKVPNFVVTSRSFNSQIAVCLSTQFDSFDLWVWVDEKNVVSEFHVPFEDLSEIMTKAFQPGELKL